MSDTKITLTASGTSIATQQTITMHKATGVEAPTGLSGIAPTTLNGIDGKITGTTAEMEYADNTDFKNAENATAIGITGLSAGTYYVRAKA